MAAMQQIANWLKKLGMSEYAERFAENDIDMAVLPDLTDEHLKHLGVSLGHRLKCCALSAISAALRLPLWRHPRRLGKTTPSAVR